MSLEMRAPCRARSWARSCSHDVSAPSAALKWARSFSRKKPLILIAIMGSNRILTSPRRSHGQHISDKPTDGAVARWHARDIARLSFIMRQVTVSHRPAAPTPSPERV